MGCCNSILDDYPLDRVKADLIAPAIVEMRRASRGVVCHRRSLLKRAAVLEMRQDPGRPETMVAMPAAAVRWRLTAWAFA
jgi:hypothetical protein